MKKLNLGCGKNYLKGWVNLDLGEYNLRNKKIKLDVSHDLNVFPYPFKDNTFDHVLIEHVLEHLKEPKKVLKEVARITRNKGSIHIICPHFSCYHTYRDPTHILYPSIQTIDYLIDHKVLKLVDSYLNVSHNKFIRLFNRIINLAPVIYERFFYGFLQVQEVIWLLKVEKTEL